MAAFTLSYTPQWKVLGMIRNCTFSVMIRSAASPGKRAHSSRFMSWVAALLLLILAPSLSMPGQTTHFTRSIWRSQDGLPENIVQALVQDRDGYLWVGTTGGLARFDGARFSPLNDGTAHTLPVNGFNCLLLSHDGTLWAGTEGGGLLHIANSEIVRSYGDAAGLTDVFVRTIYEDSIGRLWVGTASGLFLKQGERLVRIEAPGASNVQAITEDSEHNILAGGSHLISLHEGQSREIPLPSPGQNNVNSVLVAADGTLWIGTVSGLFRQAHGRFERVPEITSSVRVLHQTSDGTIWVGTIGKGVWAYRDGTLTHIGDKGPLPIDTVHSIFEDTNHRIWIGTQNGLVRLEKTPISLIPLPGFGDDNTYGTISSGPNGDIWMVAQEAFRISGGVAVPLKFPGLGDVPIRSLYSAKDGSTWVGTTGRGVYHLAAKVAHFSGAPRHYNIGNFVRGFLESTHGEIWIATDLGLYCITTKGVTRYGIADGLPHFSIRTFFEDKNHDIWVGTDHGLGRWHAGAFVQDAATTALRGEKVWSILQDRRGTMWFGTRDHGLFRYRDNLIEHYTTAQGLVSNIVYQLLQDRTGRFWISSAESISSVPEEEMDGDLLHRDSPLSVTLYRMPYEAEGEQLSGGRYPAGFLAPDDTVWFPTNRGAAHVVATDSGVDGTPVVRIVGIMQDGVNLPVNENLHLNAAAARLAFSFASLFLGPQDGIRFRYRLDGFDNDWIPAGSNHTATYTNLPAGTYHFRVRSFDLSHPALTTEATLEFVKKPFLYQTWWFRLLCLLALLGCGLFAYTVRLRKVRSRFAVVLEERGRLAREMHDTVIQGCTGVSVLLEAIATQREGPPQEDDLLDVARAQVRATIDEARRAVWDLRRKEEEEIDLHHSLAALAEQATRAFGIPVVCERIDPMSGISGSTGHELLMVAREAIANAGSHAHPDWIRIAASLEGMDLTLKVTDNGSGFLQAPPSGSTSGHYGLVGMHERMHRIGGTLAIYSVSGSGTEVVMKLRHATTKGHRSESRETLK
jgi:ligand-binding sensor domain-containing protein/two-component sensor histidine kinase